MTTGTITCGAPFLLDGLSVPNTARLFAGNRIEVSSGSCTVRTETSTVRMHEKSRFTVTRRGLELEHGVARLTGLVPFRIPHASAEVQPAGMSTAINTEFADDLWTVNVASGSAQLMGDAKEPGGDEPYVRFDAGTVMSFSPDANRAGGVYMRVKGCLTKEQDRWFLTDEHLSRRIELLEDTVRKEGQRVGVAASLERLPARSADLAARVHVLAEQRYEGKCRAFVPVLTLAGSSVMSTAVAGGTALAAPGILITTGPGTAPVPASVP